MCESVRRALRDVTDAFKRLILLALRIVVSSGSARVVLRLTQVLR